MNDFKKSYVDVVAHMRNIIDTHPDLERIEVEINDNPNVSLRREMITDKVFKIFVTEEEFDSAIRVVEEFEAKILEQQLAEGKKHKEYDELLKMFAPEEYSKKPKRELKNNPKMMTKERFIAKTREKFEKIKEIVKKIGMKALLVLLSAGLTISVIYSKVSEKPEIEKEPTTTISETIDYGNKEENEIDTIAEVEEDFIKDYLETYNEVYGTEYQTGEIIVTALRDGAVYQLEDGRKVTRGSLPYETEKVLNTIGEFDIANINSEVLQVMSNGKVLGTYNIETGEFFYSGNQISDVTNEEFDEPTLEKLGINADKLYAAARVKLAKGVEGKTSINIRINYYNDVDKGIDR